MSDASTLHPPAERLAAYRAGRLSEEEAREVMRHLLTCAPCRDSAPLNEAETIPPRPQEEAATLAKENPATAPAGVPAALANHPRYRVLQLLGAGGMGSVYKAEHRVMERPVALKVLNPRLIANAKALQRFQQEVKAAARLAHPNIVTAHDADEAGGVHFLVMEHVEGQSLAEFVDKHGRMSVPRACECIRQAALGLQHAFEKGMVHRDIKPHNLMLTPQGRIKILDFGLARFASEREGAALLTGEAAPKAPAGLTQSGMLMGTPDYLSPEQATDARTADIRADIYSLGCTLYHLLTGDAPFPDGGLLQKVLAHLEKTPRPLKEFRDDVPAELEAVVQRMLAKEPSRRFQTPAEVAKALAPFVTGTAAATRPPTPAPSPTVLKPAGRSGTTPARPVPSPAPSIIPMAPESKPRVLRDDAFKEPDKPKRTAPWAGSIYFQKPVLLAGAGLCAMVVLGAVMLNQPRREPRKSGAAAADKAETPVELPAVVPESVAGASPITPEATLPPQQAAATPKVEPLPIAIDPPRPAATAPTTEPTVEVTFEGHQGPVLGAVFTPDRRSVLTWGEDKSLRLWDAASGKPVRTFEGHTEPVLAAAIYPEGQRFLSASFDGTVRLWDFQTTQPVLPVLTNLGRLRCLALSPDGRLGLAAGQGHNDRIVLWNAATGVLMGTLAGHTDGVVAAVFSPGGRSVYSVSWDKTVRAWDAATLSQTKKFDHDAPVQSLALSREGNYLLTGTRTGILSLFDTATGSLLHRSSASKTQINSIAFSSDGEHALVAAGGTGPALEAWTPGTYNLLAWWNVRTWRESWRHEGYTGPILMAALSDDGRSALTSHWDNAARLWKLPTVQTSTPAPVVRTAQLVIESEEPGARFVVKRDGKVVAGPTSERLLELSPGTYEIDWPKPEPLLFLSTSRFELLPGGQKVISIRRARLAWPEAGVPAPDLTILTPVHDYDLRKPASGFPQTSHAGKGGGTVTTGYGHDVYFLDMKKPLGTILGCVVPIPAKPGPDFACEVVGHVVEPGVVWALRLRNADRDNITDVAVDNFGGLAIWKKSSPGDKSRPVLAGPFKPPSLKTKGEFNRLLVVLRGRVLEVYVNGHSACDPVVLEPDALPSQLFLNTQGTHKWLHAEFERVRLFPPDKLPTPQARGAVVK